MSDYELIIFDCDGTLTDSEYAYNVCSVEVFKDYGLDYTVEYALQNWMGKSQDDIIRMEAEKNKIDLPAKEMIEKFIANTPIYQKKYLKFIPGANEAVETLQKNFKCCVASNGERLNVVNSLKLLKFSSFFNDDHIFTKNDVARAKPFPDLFEFACQKMESAPERAIVIEDSVSGVKAGRAANTYVIGFNGLGHEDLQSKDKLMEAGADIVFSDWKDILSHINS